MYSHSGFRTWGARCQSILLSKWAAAAAARSKVRWQQSPRLLFLPPRLSLLLPPTRPIGRHLYLAAPGDADLFLEASANCPILVTRHLMSNRFLLSNGGNVDPPYISWTKTPATAAAALTSGAAAAMLLDRTKNALSTCEKSLVKPLSPSLAHSRVIHPS